MSDSDIAGLRADNRRLEQKIDDLQKTVNDMAQAFAKSSSKHSQRLTHIEGDLKIAHDRISNVKKWVVGGLVTIATMAVKYAWSIIESVARKG